MARPPLLFQEGNTLVFKVTQCPESPFLDAEVFNMLDTVNFGGQYQGNGRSATFREPTAFVPGIGYSRQLQVGARFLF